jgi:DNA ligase-1
MNYDKFKPMKPPSGTLDLDAVKYDCLGQIKYDGIRCVIKDGRTYTNSLKEIPNRYVREQVRQYAPLIDKFDGEFIIGPPNANDCFNVTTSGIMSQDGEPNFTFVVFDRVDDGDYYERFVSFSFYEELPPWVKFTKSIKIQNREKLDQIVNSTVDAGYEGLILRNPNLPYKFGRATFKSQEVLRIKPFEDDEAVITGFECEYANTNEAELDNHGHTKRSSSKEGKVAKETMGKLICEHPVWGELKVSGGDRKFKDDVFNNFEMYRGQLVVFKYQKHGTLDKPRLLKLKGIRDPRDMS